MKVFKSCLFFISSVFFTMTCSPVFAHPCSRGDRSYHCDYFILESIVCEENTSSAEEMNCMLPNFNLSVTFLKPEVEPMIKDRIIHEILQLCGANAACSKQFHCDFAAYYCQRD